MGGRSWRASVEGAQTRQDGRKGFLASPRSLYKTIKKLTPSTKPAFLDDTSWIAVANFATFFATELCRFATAMIYCRETPV